ncbi:hypothetical protein C0993_012203, partial [Termitomyces sp. T159_Od127]
MTTHRLSSPSLSATSAEYEGMQTLSHARHERCGVPSPNHPAPPNLDGKPQGHTQPAAGTLPRRVRGVRIVPKPILELVRMHPNLKLDEFQSGAGFFVPAIRSPLRIHSSDAYAERKSVIAKIYDASAPGALFDSQDRLPLLQVGLEAQTRTAQTAWQWFTAPESKPLLSIHASSQLVKSMIAHTLVKKSKKRGGFAASFFFTSLRANCSSAKCFVPTIVVQFIKHIPGFSDSLIESMHREPFIIQGSPLEMQVDQLIIKPLYNVTARGPFLIIIDALDRCAKEEDRREILTQISRIVRAHQGLLRFVVLTSGMERLFNEPEF